MRDQATDRAATRLLTRHFLRRFVDNDLLSPSGDGHHAVAFVIAVLLMTGLWVSGTFVLKTTSPFVSPFGILLSGLNDKYTGLAASMVVTALCAVLEWDGLGLDRRDWLVLTPLPISARVVMIAKFRALALFVGVFAIALNGIVAVTYPPLQADKLPIGIIGVLWLGGAHLLASFCACGFGFLVALLLRELIVAIAPRPLSRHILSVAQFLAVLLLTTALLLVATLKPDVLANLKTGGRGVTMSPPMWFVGGYETIVAPVLRNAPALAPTRKRQYWTLQQNQAARREYRDQAESLEHLAAIVAVVLSALAVLCSVAVIANRRPIAPPGAGRLSVSRSAGLWGRSILHRFLLPHPDSQAAFHFTLETLTRSASHRAYIAASLAMGVAVAVVTVRASGLFPLPDAPVVPVAFLAIQFILVFFLVTGARLIFAVPSELRANWLFRSAWDRDWWRYLAGVAWAVRLGLALPLLTVLVPFHAYFAGWSGAALHLLVGLFAAAMLSGALLVGLNKVPFTCSYSPRGTLRTRWPWYLLGFVAFTFGLATLERLAWSTGHLPSFLAVLGVLAVVPTLVARRRLRHPTPVVFDDASEDAIQQLGLGVS